MFDFLEGCAIHCILSQSYHSRATDKDDDEKKEKKERKKRDDKKEKRERRMREDSSDGEGEWETVKGGVAIPSVGLCGITSRIRRK